MKNLLILGLLFVSISMYSCKKEKVQIPTCEDCNFTCLEVNEADVISNECIDNWDCSFKITPQSQVDINETTGLTSGDKNVFQMINSTEGSLQIADDEFTHTLVFELDESQNSFSIADNQLKDMQVHFQIYCYCIVSSIFFVLHFVEIKQTE